MNKELAKKAKHFIRSHPELYLQRAKRSGYVCPLPDCQNGTHKNGTGIEPGGRDHLHFTCFRCNRYKHADVIDLIGLVHDVSDFPGKFKLACKEYQTHLLSIGISLDDLFPPAVHRTLNKKHEHKSCSTSMNTKRVQQTCSTNMNIKVEHEHSQSTTPMEQPQASGNSTEQAHPSQTPRPLRKDIDHSKLFDEWHENIDKTSYHRGLSKETLDRFNVGFCEQWISPEPPTNPEVKRFPAPMIIIPTSKFSGIARDTRPGKKHFHQIGSRRLFNVEALYKSKKPVFIVESEIDALSVEDVGGSAVGLGGTSMVEALVKTVKNYRPSQPLILSLDSDEKGKQHQAKLKKELDKIGVFYQEISVNLDYKDANEALENDRAKFTEAVEEAVSIATLAQAELMDSTSEELKVDTVSYALGGFMQRVEAKKDEVVRATGFEKLDKLLRGGLRAGLYIVGGDSSLGKTSFCIQMLDQMARNGNSVLIFSLEMGKDTLIGKSLSRFTYLFAKDKQHAKDVETVMNWNLRRTFEQETLALIDKAIQEYRSFGEKVSIIEGDNSTCVSEVRAAVKKHVDATGKAPIVLVDYLQILAYSEDGSTDKQNVDRTVSELKRISRDFNVPLIAVSSLNRASYENPVGLASFKESGGIEYSSDVLIGLQYHGTEPPWDVEETVVEANRRKQQVKKMAEGVDMEDTDAVDVEIKVLKNRTGVKGRVHLKFYRAFSCFSEVENPYVASSGYDDQDLDMD